MNEFFKFLVAFLSCSKTTLKKSFLKFFYCIDSKCVLETFFRRFLILIALKYVSLFFVTFETFAFSLSGLAEFSFVLISELDGKANTFFSWFSTTVFF